MTNIEKIFEELFGEGFVSDFESKFRENIEKKFADISEELDKEDGDESYYNKICDKYKNGEHISHDEVEIKNGKVVKDIHQTKNIEDKGGECSKKCCSSCEDGIATTNGTKVPEVDVYKKKIEKLFKRIDKLNQENEEYENKIQDLENVVKEQSGLINTLEKKLNNLRNILK